MIRKRGGGARKGKKGSGREGSDYNCLRRSNKKNSSKTVGIGIQSEKRNVGGKKLMRQTMVTVVTLSPCWGKVQRNVHSAKGRGVGEEEKLGRGTKYSITVQPG